jgi:hypothetical protein
MINDVISQKAAAVMTADNIARTKNGIESMRTAQPPAARSSVAVK